ncbi:MAG TPA: hypothetical protein VFK06_25685 [Candidatus Angelobacter sp.]|nr:hypothetical protein [Candidatus Angelobacter sp.]
MKGHYPGHSMAKVFMTRTLPLLAFLLLYSTLTPAQDSPGRFEIGGSLTAIDNPPFFGSLGPSLEGDVNFGSHLALDSALTWLPSSRGNTVLGLFGVKAGGRTEHFGLFAKVRPGFVTSFHSLRESTINVISNQNAVFSQRFDPLTERALDLGGVVEYYPAKHWTMRWDLGETLLFQEASNKFSIVNGGTTTTTFFPPARNTSQFQFSTGVHYRF